MHFQPHLWTRALLNNWMRRNRVRIGRAIQPGKEEVEPKAKPTVNEKADKKPKHEKVVKELYYDLFNKRALSSHNLNLFM